MYTPPRFNSVDFRFGAGYVAPNGTVDIQFSKTNGWGHGSISGVVRVSGTPVEGYIVDLIQMGTELFVDRTVTDAVGAYIFENVDNGWTYDAIAYDPDSVWEKKVSSRRVPVA